MPRLNDLEQVMFPVDEYPVFTVVETKAGKQQIPVPDKKAIVNCTNNRVLGVVSRGYRLVSNREALSMAYDCCRVVFPETKPGEWGVSVTDAPATGGHCCIDLVHNSTALDFSFVKADDKPDAFGPFIRVVNSYNGLRALSFNIGYHRKVCKNGLILPGTVIRFKFSHLQREIGEIIQFEIDHEEIAKMKTYIGDYFKVLQNYAVKRQYFEPMVKAVLLLRKPKNAEPQTPGADDWDKLETHIEEMCEKYASELGANAYAVFNTVTEFASHPPENRCVYRERHGFQRRAGSWLATFTHECKQPGFDLQKHIEKFAMGDVNDEEQPPTIQGANHDREQPLQRIQHFRNVDGGEVSW